MRLSSLPFVRGLAGFLRLGLRTMRFAKHCPVAGRYLVFNGFGGSSISDLFLRSGATRVDLIHRRISRRPRRFMRQVWTFVGVVWHGIVLSGAFPKHLPTSVARHNGPHGVVRRLSLSDCRKRASCAESSARWPCRNRPIDPLAYAAAEHSGRSECRGRASLLVWRVVVWPRSHCGTPVTRQMLLPTSSATNNPPR